MRIDLKHEQKIIATFDKRMAQLIHDALKDSGLSDVQAFKKALKTFAYDTCDRCRFVALRYGIGDTCVCDHPYKNQDGHNPITDQGCPWFSPDPEKLLPGETIRYCIWHKEEIMRLPEKEKKEQPETKET
jgi:hypothetical protein